MKKSIGVDALLGGAIVGLFIAMRSAAATEPSAFARVPHAVRSYDNPAATDGVSMSTPRVCRPIPLVGPNQINGDARPCAPELQ
jgi:hypothetical protein